MQPDPEITLSLILTLSCISSLLIFVGFVKPLSTSNRSLQGGEISSAISYSQYLVLAFASFTLSLIPSIGLAALIFQVMRWL